MNDISPFRPAHDFYPTPAEGTLALLSVERFRGPIWEPACGDGGIAKVLTAAGYHVVGTDLIDRGYGLGGVNFLAETRNRARHIITNPPYLKGIADRFVRHALRLARPVNGTVAMLVNLASLAHPSRTSLYTTHPPTSVYILDELVCHPGGIPNPLTLGNYAQHRYCWLVWKPGHTGRPSLWWLETGRFRERTSLK